MEFKVGPLYTTLDQHVQFQAVIYNFGRPYAILDNHIKFQKSISSLWECSNSWGGGDSLEEERGVRSKC